MIRFSLYVGLSGQFVFICGSVPDGIVDQGDHVLGNIVVRQAVTEGDGQISSFCPGQHEADLLTLIISHKLNQSL